MLSRWCDGISSFCHWHTFEWASRNIHFRPSGHFRLLSWNRNLLTHLQNYFRLFHRMCDCLFWSGYSRAVPTRTEKIKLTSFTNSKMRLVQMNESRWPNFGWILTKKSLHWRILTLEYDPNSWHRQTLTLPPKNMLVQTAWTGPPAPACKLALPWTPAQSH